MVISESLYLDFVQEVKRNWPKKSFGYFLANDYGEDPDDFVMFTKDLRDEIKDQFELYGNYYINNKDAGFLADPYETLELEKKLIRRKKKKVGVFHSHKRHPSIFSSVDIDLHPDKRLWHLIISLRNMNMPQIKVFQIRDDEKIREIEWQF
mgnify:CR=1 FL=1